MEFAFLPRQALGEPENYIFTSFTYLGVDNFLSESFPQPAEADHVED
jgi:hypothetical protein